MKISVVIRTLNEAKHLPALLQGISEQALHEEDQVEVVVVDSGSTDETLAIAESYQARIVHIKKSDFTFGRSLNVGCKAATGDVLVIVSGHCVPVNEAWLSALVAPIRQGLAVYTYGKQIIAEDGRYSEGQILKKYFPDVSRIPQEGFFVNNANSAISRSHWQMEQFDEALTGLEDMALGKRLVERGFALAYCSDAVVFHIHDESWRQVKRRYEREAIALQQIMPEVQISILDFLRFYLSAILLDAGQALQDRKLHKVIKEILLFRLMQFLGAYRGNHQHRILSKEAKYKYFYPK